MNVRYFSKYSDSGPSSRFRLFQFLDLFREQGVHISVQPLFDDTYLEIIRKPRSLTNAVHKFVYAWTRFAERVKNVSSYDADLTIIEHQLFPYIPYFFEQAILPDRYTLEFDDAIYLTHPAKLPSLIKGAAAVIAGNRYLADYALQYQSNVHVIPTVLNTDIFHTKAKTQSDKIRIGWSGLEYNFKYLSTIEPALAALQKRHSIEIVILSGTPPRNFSVPFRFVKWDKHSEVEQLNDFDIGVMPLETDEWCRGKCGFKLLQYMALEIPSIATPVGVNSDIIRPGENGFTAITQQEWEDTLALLIKDQSLRERIGKEARNTVVEHYSTSAWFPKLLELYRSLAL